MTHNLERKQNYLTLAIHSTDVSFCFGYRTNNNVESDQLFIKQFENDFCNKLIVEFQKFISKENLQRVNRMSVSIGPANFNASRLVVVLARTISQQISCPLEGFSSFRIMAKRIAKKNKICKNKQSFWIYKKLKLKGFIAGKYEIRYDEQNADLVIKETVLPKIIQELESKQIAFEATYDDDDDLKELLDLANKNSSNTNIISWQKVLPLYPISPVN